MTTATKTTKGTTAISSDLLITPVSDVEFMAIHRPIQSKFTGNEEFIVRIAVDNKAAGAAEFLAAIKEINENRLGSKANTDDKTVLTFKSKYAPKVMDKNGQVIPHEDLVPLGAEGTAKVALGITKGKTNQTGVGASLYLKEVVLMEFNPVETTAIKSKLQALAESGELGS